MDFSSVGLSTDRSTVQRIKIVDAKSNDIAGYLSFCCSLTQLMPIMTIESCKEYKVCEEHCPFGGGSMHISVKKDM